MKLSFSPIFFSIFLLLQAIFSPSLAVAADCSINNLLKIGSRGAEVVCLQEKLAILPDGVFGPITKASLAAFQTSHGLTPDGIVGPFTRASLATTIASGGVFPNGCVSSVGYSTLTGEKCDGMSNNSMVMEVKSEELTEVEENANPNLVNLDKFIEIVVKFNKDHGASEKELKTMATAIRNEATNSKIDYKKEFSAMLAKQAAAYEKPSIGFLDKVFSEMLSFVGLKPEVAEAQVAGVPFGGLIEYAFLCPLSGNWNIALTPLPPSFATTLSYTPGIQRFPYYTLNAAHPGLWVLGTYTPVGECVIPIPNPALIPPVIPFAIPTWGNITPVVGSSL